MHRRKASNFHMSSLQFTSTGGLRVIYILVAICLIAAANDYEQEIPCDEPYLEGNADDNIGNMLMFPDENLDESALFSEDNELLEFEDETNVKVESESHIFRKKTFKRNKDDFYPTSSIKKRRLHKRAVTSCAPTVLSIQCNATSKYRTQNGTCNNLKHPEWGMANGCEIRLLPANYNGTSGFRGSVEGGPLPEPRQISLSVCEDEDLPTKQPNHLFMFIGQLMTHDKVLTATPVTNTGETLDCCDPKLKNNSPWCSSTINVQKNDTFYKHYNVTCLNFGKSASCGSCSQGDRLILNLVTAFIDGSQVYGSSENTSRALRTNDGTGKLRSQQNVYGEALLPDSSDPAHDECSFPSQKKICFEAGDVRVNQHTTLTCLQTILLRLHNKIATILKQINPSWGEEKLFQETRRIVAAALQIILYKEYLPILLSYDTISKYGLDVPNGFTTYRPDINPSILLEDSTAAFRIQHSMVNTIVALKPLKVTEGKTKFRDTYSRPFGLRKGRCDQLIVDTTITPAQMIDRYEVIDITDYLYRAPGQSFGSDLAASDINRGRDHGIPTYVDMLKYCTNKTVSDFEDLLTFNLISKANVDKLKDNYDNVKDVDLEIGMLMEIPMNGSLCGPTSNCVIGIQFSRLKYGDRFYFQHGGQAGSFKEGQLNELKKITLTKVFCFTTTILALPENAMLFASKVNPEVICKGVQFLNFAQWIE